MVGGGGSGDGREQAWYQGSVAPLAALVLIAVAVATHRHTHAFIDFQHEPPPNVCETVWSGTASARASTPRHVSIVVSHYHHNLSWLGGWAHGVAIRNITVFSKGSRPVIGAPAGTRVERLPNTGRCDHTYAHFMAHYADDLLDDEVVVFIKDTRLNHQSGEFRSLSEMSLAAAERGFGCGMSPGDENSLWHETRMLRTFTKADYLSPDGSRSGSGFQSNLKNLDGWWATVGHETNALIVPVCYGGLFATTSAAIRRGARLWPRIEASLERGDNIEEGHFAERSWGVMLQQTPSTGTARALLSAVTVSPSDTRDVIGRHGMCGRTLFFHHIYDAGNGVGVSIANEQSQQLRDAGYTWPIQQTVIGAPPSDIRCPPPCERRRRARRGSEILTLQPLYEHCRANPTDRVVYAHNKGSFHDTPENERFRRFLMRGILADQGCATHQPATCDVCASRFSMLPHFHAPGNIWVAHCDYVLRLISPHDFPAAMDSLFEPPNEWRHPRYGYGEDPIVATGRFAMEHWVHSHPSLAPCDVYDGDDYVWGDINLPKNKSLWAPSVADAPRFPLETYFRTNFPGGISFTNSFKAHPWYTYDSRIYEWKKLYGHVPPYPLRAMAVAYGLESDNKSQSLLDAVRYCEAHIDLRKDICRGSCAPRHAAACRSHWEEVGAAEGRGGWGSRPGAQTVCAGKKTVGASQQPCNCSVHCHTCVGNVCLMCKNKAALLRGQCVSTGDCMKAGGDVVGTGSYKRQCQDA